MRNYNFLDNACLACRGHPCYHLNLRACSYGGWGELLGGKVAVRRNPTSVAQIPGKLAAHEPHKWGSF